MNIDFQFNRITLQQFQKDLVMREKSLPILHAKEAALRLELKELKKKLAKMLLVKENLYQPVKQNMQLWAEFPDILKIEKVVIKKRNIAGVKLEIFQNVEFALKPFLLFNSPKWIISGTELLKHYINNEIELKIEKSNHAKLELAARKTTQKVNLYEKVQIPFFQSAILRIKRFIEDEENLSRASQKIMKRKQDR